MGRELDRLEESRRREVHWKRWGPYLADRAWGTVREDYSADGDAWAFFPFEHARSRVYRWNEDGLAGFCDRHQRICFSVALWNGRDPILKERLFGLSGPQGNHGEDAKEQWFHLDATPTHSWMRMLYKYPQAPFPYERLVEENARRGYDDPEFELEDTGVFDDDRVFDVLVEYAKEDQEDWLVRVTATNRGPDPAEIHLLPTVWFRNVWSWDATEPRPELRRSDPASIRLDGTRYGVRHLHAEGAPEMLFTENETNAERLFGTENATLFVKDGIDDRVVRGDVSATNPDGTGTRAALRYRRTLAPGESFTVRLAFVRRESVPPGWWATGHGEVFAAREREAEEFYATVVPASLSEDARRVMRQSLAGLLWSKQYYHYVVKDWLDGDPGQPPPPPERRLGRNAGWDLLHNADVLSMPDKWEYPWYAAWDLAFHCVPLALVDPDFAKEQLILLLREWYQHPNGQLPAYEWALGDVNPPVHAWAAWRVYKIERKVRGRADRVFLERIFHKLLLNFTWWVNRKDPDGMNVFQGGFLGLDNIGVFDRSRPLPGGGHLDQSDGTAWMAMYSLDMLAIAIELAREDPAYEDVASKFWEHFLHIASAMHDRGGHGVDMWDEEDGFYYDVLHRPDGTAEPLRLRSMVGLAPLFAVQTMECEDLDRLPGFRRRMEWFMENRPDLTAHVASMSAGGVCERRLLSLVSPERLRRVLRVMLDEEEFLSPHGIRAMSRVHRDRPFVFRVDGVEHRVDYRPAESDSGFFGGNSNWRGPIWFPVNVLLIESLQKLHHYLGDGFRVECPTGSGREMSLDQVAAEISRRLSRLFLRGPDGRRPVHGASERFRSDPHWRDLVLFFEYFDGDDGRGLGASHQTGWTALVAKLLAQSGE